MKISAKNYKLIMSLYPPYLGAGISIKSVSSNFMEIQVTLVKRWYNRNVRNTHFGGSIYSMTDPHFMFIISNALGEDYIVWDKEAYVNFIKAVKTKITAHMSISEEQIEEIRKATATGEKYLPKYTVDIKTDDGTLVAQVIKTIYIRKKRNKINY